VARSRKRDGILDWQWQARVILLRAFSTALTWLGLILAAYVLSPFATAAVLGMAIRDGNERVMTTLVDFPQIRDTVRASVLARLDEKTLTRPDHPSFTQRVKFGLADTLTPYVVDYMLDQRISPAGFALYMGPNSPGAQKARAAGLDPDSMPNASILTRIRLARFLDPTHFEFEVIDRWDAGKVFRAVFELKDFFWRMNVVEVLALGEGA
jgi:hypothetical protein